MCAWLFVLHNIHGVGLIKNKRTKPSVFCLALPPWSSLKFQEGSDQALTLQEGLHLCCLTPVEKNKLWIQRLNIEGWYLGDHNIACCVHSWWLCWSQCPLNGLKPVLSASQPHTLIKTTTHTAAFSGPEQICLKLLQWVSGDHYRKKPAAV